MMHNTQPRELILEFIYSRPNFLIFKIINNIEKDRKYLIKNFGRYNYPEDVRKPRG